MKKRIAQELVEVQRNQLITSSRLASLGEIAASIGHEINNPMAIICGKASEIREMIEEDAIDLKELIRIVDKIDATTDRVSKIISSLMALSRNSQDESFSLNSVNKIVDDTFELCKLRFSAHGIKLTIAPVNESLTIECNPTQISQVLLNLLNNAHDATLEARNSPPWVHLEVKELDDSIEFHIENSGNKISDELRENIFKPFFTTKGFGKGTGLGLTIVSRIVTGHKGSISLDLLSDHTKFIVTLPKIAQTSDS